VLDVRLIALGGLGGTPLQLVTLGLLESDSPPQVLGPMLGRRPKPARGRDDEVALLLSLGLL
jgi:hypothetical protein